jgi:hypothetical protein
MLYNSNKLLVKVQEAKEPQLNQHLLKLHQLKPEVKEHQVNCHLMNQTYHYQLLELRVLYFSLIIE